MTRRQEQPALDLFIRRLKSSAPFGVAAYAIGYLLTAGALVLDGVETFGIDAPFWKITGWTFYGAHRVKLEMIRDGHHRFGLILSESGRQGTQLTTTVPTVVYQFLPIALLMVAGFVIYRQSDKEDPSTKLTATLGTTIVAGYLPIGVVGRFVFSHSNTETFMDLTLTTSALPELTGSILVLGIGYPLVFGALGALLGRHRERQQHSTRADDCRAQPRKNDSGSLTRRS